MNFFPRTPPAGARLLCFGGSFNPIHHGHLICARSVCESLHYDGVLFIPSAQPPHKPLAADLAAAADRLKMAQLAISAQSSPFYVTDLELRRPGPSYTIDTARELRKQGWPRVDWLIGADMAASLPTWHLADQLIQEVNFVLMARPGWQFNFATLPPAYQRLEKNVVQAPLIDISATDVRSRVRSGLPIDFLTPPAVVEYIVQKALYRTQITS